MWDVALQGLYLVVQWPAIGYMFLGVLVGLYVGAVPGLGGIVALSILLPFTFDMDPASAFAMLLGMYAVTSTGDTLASVLLGVPGTAASQATILDGYPMAQKGEASRAFGAAFTCSAIGGILGALALGLTIPIIRPVIMAFAQPEFFALGVLGLIMVGSLSGNSILKGLVAAMFGLLISQIGYSVQGGTSRYDFGLLYLLDGLPLIAVVLGFFAIPELFSLAVRNVSIAGRSQEEAVVRRSRQWKLLRQGIGDAFRHWWLVFRCSVIGMYIGILPGIGGSIVDWLAYGHALQSAKDKSQFGKGDVRGVLAPEAANNAVRGPALIPTVAFGIPGTASMAILLGAFLIQGLTPGPEMLNTKLDITFSFVWTLVFANIIGAGLMLLWANQLAKATFVRGNLIVPSIILFVFMGSWMATQGLGDWYTLLAFGLIGYAMKSGGWPRPPFVLGFILGPIMENAFDISLQVYGWSWYERPITAGIFLFVGVVLAFATWRAYRRRSGEKLASWMRDGAVLPAKPPSEKFDLSFSLPLGVAFLVVFTVALLMAKDWSYSARLFPLAVTIPAILLLLVLVAREALQYLNLCKASASLGAAFKAGFDNPGEQLQVAKVLLWLVGLVVLTVLLGQPIAIPLIMFLYLRFWARERWVMAVSQGVVGAAFLYVMFEMFISVSWYDAILLRAF